MGGGAGRGSGLRFEEFALEGASALTCLCVACTQMRSGLLKRLMQSTFGVMDRSNKYGMAMAIATEETLCVCA